MSDNVFVYGTLMRGAHEAARLHGYRLDFGSFATVVEDTGGTVYGGLIRDVTPAQLRTFDQIEGVSSGYYSRRPVTVYSGEHETTRQNEAWVYVMSARDLLASKRGRYGTPDALAEGMHLQYERMGHPAAAHEALDASVRNWHRECAAHRGWLLAGWRP